MRKMLSFVLFPPMSVAIHGLAGTDGQTLGLETRQ
jgi:hypothetical protein